MKLIAKFALCLAAPVGLLSVSLNEPTLFSTYLSDSIGADPRSGVFLPSMLIGEGHSTPMAGLDVIGVTQNKFVRLANFNASKGIPYSSASFYSEPISKHAQFELSFNYRFFDSYCPYQADDAVLSFNLGEQRIEVLYNELSFVDAGSSSWLSLTKTIDAEASIATHLTCSFYFVEEQKSDNPNVYIDLDNVSLKSNGKEYLTCGGMDKLSVSESSSKVREIDISGDEREKHLNMVLQPESISAYSKNTILGEEMIEGGNMQYADSYYPLDLSGDAANPFYRGATSVSEKESDIYLMHRDEENNTFLRMGNYNGKNEVTTRFINYFYNNEEGKAENMGKAQFAYVSFKYRLHMSKEKQAEFIANGWPVFDISTRLSQSRSKTGLVYLPSLEVNEEGDESWHTFKTRIWMSTSPSTAYFIFYFNHHEKASAEPSLYCDIDDFSFASIREPGKNLVVANGTMDLGKKMIPLSISETRQRPFMGTVFSCVKNGKQSQFGVSSKKPVLKVQKGGTFSFLSKQTLEPACYRLSLSGKGDFSGLSMLLGGQAGTKYDLSNSDRFHSVSISESGIEAYVTAKYPFAFADLLSSNELTIESMSLRKVESICVDAGDYESFLSYVTPRVESIERMNLSAKDKAMFEAIKEMLSKEDSHSSEARLDKAKEQFDSFVDSLTMESDLSSLEKEIENAQNVLALDLEGRVGKDLIMRLDECLRNALKLGCFDPQETIDKATSDLKEAIDDILEAINE